MLGGITAGNSVLAGAIKNSGQAHFDFFEIGQGQIAMLVKKALYVNRLNRGQIGIAEKGN